MSRRTLLALAALAAAANAYPAQAAALYSGGVYSQDFNTLPISPVNASLGTTADARGWIDDAAAPAANQYSIIGWYIYHPTVQAEGGISGNQRLRVSGLPTTAATGSFYSFGNNIAPASTERALGVVPSATLTPSNGEVYMGLRLTNNTANTLKQFTFSYTGEQWRAALDTAAGSPGNESLTVDYRLGGTDLQSGTFTEIPSATFDSIVDQAPGSPQQPHLDGNDPANRINGLGATVTGIDWAPGTDLWVRWTGINKFGSAELADHGLAIDDLTFSAAVPEPSGLALAVLAGAGMIARRRRLR